MTFSSAPTYQEPSSMILTPTTMLYFYNICMFIYLSTSIVNKKYPGFYKQVVVGIAYNVIRLYSKAELFYRNNIKSLTLVNKDEFVSFISNNTIVVVLEKDEILNLEECPEYDFIMYEDSKNNRSFMYDLYEEGVVCEKTDYTFVLFEVIIDEDTYKIELKSDTYNYYVVGNVFNKTIISYLLKTYFDLDDVTEYKVRLLDHNVESIEFDEQKSLELNKEAYKII